MPYAMILIAALIAGCSEAKTPSKDAVTEVASVTSVVPADPTGAASTDIALERIDKGDGLVVDVLQAGAGRVVQMGDTVTLEYTISFVPPPPGKVDAKVAKDAKSAPKHDAKKPLKKSGEKPDETKPTAAEDQAKKDGESKGAETKDGEKKDTEKKDTEKKDAEKKDVEKHDAGKTDDAKKDDAKSEADKKPAEGKDGEKPATETPNAEKHDGAKNDAAKTDAAKQDPEKPVTPADATKPDATHEPGDAPKPATDPAKPDDKPADAKPLEPQKPVVVASTKSLLTPFTVKLSNNGKPKLMPGLVRGIEGLKVGTHARITVPAALAYGKDGNISAGIPAETSVEIDVVVKEARE